MHSAARSSTSEPEAAARLLELIQMRLISEAIHVVAVLGVADLLADAPKSVEQLAEASGASLPALSRVMRALASFGVFSQDSAGRFALAPLGEFLKREVTGSLHGAALFFGGDTGTSTVRLFLECVKTGESATQTLSDRKGCFEWLQSDPERNKLFNSMMTSFSILHITGLLEAYDFSAATKVVDVGGGHGKILSEILKRNPGMRGVLFDMPHASEGGQRTIAQAGLADRCDVISGDFFISVPAGADAYLLSRVIHDWDDEKAVAILKIVRGAIAPHGRLILLETMLRPDGSTVYPVLSDLNMLLLTGGCERTEEEYREIYRSAGFELTKTVATRSPTGMTVIEGMPKALRVFGCVLAVALLWGLCAAPVGASQPKAGQNQKQPNPYRLQGMKAAVADIEAGKLKQKSGALPDPPWHGRYVELLKKECGVEWETVTDKTTAKLIAEMGGYNDVMRVEIEDRFGRDVLDKLQKKAEAEFRKSTGAERTGRKDMHGPKGRPKGHA